MKMISRWFIKSFIVFVFVFVFFRGVFYLYYIEKMPKDEAFYTILNSFWYALPLDFAMAAIFMIVPWILFSIYLVYRHHIILLLIKTWFIFVAVFYVCLQIAELGTYGEWEEKPNFEILTYLKNPTEALQTVPVFTGIVLSIILIISILILIKVINKCFVIDKTMEPRNWLFILLFPFIIPLLILIIARGGFNSIPITSSDVYFSKSKFINDVTTNSGYYFIHSLLEHRDLIQGNTPFVLAKEERSKQILNPLLNLQCDAPKIFNQNRPNIAVIILESWSADMIETGGGYKGVTPEFEKLIKKGLYFSKAYSVGTLSHEGLPAILSGFPKIPNYHITNNPTKFNKLPKLSTSLKEESYQSLFLFGGQLRYGNIKSYIYGSDYDKIIEEKDFPNSIPHGMLGVHDEFSLKVFANEMDKLVPPFLSTIFTVSSHSPYDQPMGWRIDWGASERPYVNSVNYSDMAIGQFFEQIKDSKWYKDTVFVLIADHSHLTPKKWPRAKKEWRKIPFLIVGEPLKEAYRGIVIDYPVSQIDMPSTLLSQLNIDNNDYLWSKNVLCDSYEPSAYFANNNGFGMITNQGYVSYDYPQDMVLYQSYLDDKDINLKRQRLLNQGKNYLDFLFRTIVLDSQE